jgi:hypothetical protein
MRMTHLEHRFVDEVPETPEAGVWYISLRFNTSLHLCACGCDNETWIPIRPDKHHLTFDGETVTLHGSVGNWRFPCRSHYWIRNDRIDWIVDRPNPIPTPEPWWRRILVPLQWAGSLLRRGSA